MTDRKPKRRERRTRGEGSLTDISDGRGTRWLVRVPVRAGPKGQRRTRVRQIVDGPRKLAERVRADMAARAHTKRLVLPSSMTLEAWLEAFRERVKHEVGPRTLQDYRMDAAAYFPQVLLDTPLADLDATLIQAWVDELVNERKLAPRTVQKAHALLRRALTFAVMAGKLETNPAAKPHVRLPRVRRREFRAFTPEEAETFTRVCVEEARHGALLLVLLFGGLRPAEAYALRWSDLDGAVLRVRHSLFRPVDAPSSYQILAPKTNKARAVPLPAFVVDELRLHRQALARTKGLGWVGPDAFMFPGEDGQPLHHENVVRRHFRPLCKAAGLPKLRLYDLRHSCASLLLAAGVHPKVVQERLGHATIGLTMDTYSHLAPGMQEAAAGTLDGRFRRAAGSD